MKTAIVYYSMSDNTAFAAKMIAEEMPADTIAIVPKKAYPSTGFKKFLWGGKSVLMKEKPELLAYEFDASAYDRVVLGTPVWAGTFAPPLRTFIEEQREALGDKRLAAFACSAGGDASGCLEKLKEFLGIDAFEAELSLVDPKDKRTRENDRAIHAFCSQLG